jgi:polynucleotide kinase-phosphatase
MTITIPDFALVMLIGIAGAGKSTFAARHFAPDEVLSSDRIRAEIGSGEADQSVSAEAWKLLHDRLHARLAARLLTVVDATNLERHHREAVAEIGRQHNAELVAILLDLPLQECQRRNAARPDRVVPREALLRQAVNMARTRLQIAGEGFAAIHPLAGIEAVNAAQVERRPMRSDLRHLHGPFDIVGDIHGCFDELATLLERLGYTIEEDAGASDGLGGFRVTPPEGRTLICVGDYVDRGPDPARVLRLVMGMHAAGTAICAQGNHDHKLARALEGKKVSVSHGLKETLAALDDEPPALREQVRAWLRTLEPHYVLDDERLVVAHAGMLPEYQMRESRRARSFALFGDTTGEYDALGLPVRRNWAMRYSGEAVIVYGHVPLAHTGWVNNTLDVDTGCTFGNALTALRYPEREIVSVPAQRVYYAPPRPLFAPDWEPPRPAAQASPSAD